MAVRFEQKLPKRGEVLEALKSVGIPADVEHETIVIGWILSDERACFRWSSATPDELDLANQHVDGTGARFLEAALSRGPFTYDQSTPGVGAKAVAATVAKVVCRELEVGDTLLDLFGFAYDMVVETNGEFSYLPAVLFFSWGIEVDSVGDVLHVSLPQRLMKWMNYETLAGVQVVQLNRPSSSPSRLEDVEIADEINTLIEPTYYNGPRPSEPPVNESPLRVEWLASVCEITCGQRAEIHTLVFPADNADGPFAVLHHGEGGYRFDVRNPALRAMTQPLWSTYIKLPFRSGKRHWEFVIEVPWWARFRRLLRRAAGLLLSSRWTARKR